ncbi:MAG: zinc metalloprotease HtpX [Candidatus Moduliflexus flocculans]|nr:zinc metalloprotease HtpX [Candidatus Moduliflexus flocculans]
MARLPRDFYEIQERQRRRSLPLFARRPRLPFRPHRRRRPGLPGHASASSSGTGLARLAGLLAALPRSATWSRWPWSSPSSTSWTPARTAPRFILKRLQAATPDAADRYHVQFLHTLDEIRIAAGLPRVNAYVLPSFAVNSLAVIEDDGTPAVAVTEGLLAEGTRDELQAVAAHELAHIARGDAFYLTLVCSLANLFEKFKDALEPEDDDRAGCGRVRPRRRLGFPPVLFYAAVALSALVMRLLSMLVSRERELLADAAAVELCRAPEALARIVYKAHIKNSFVGRFLAELRPPLHRPPGLARHAGQPPGPDLQLAPPAHEASRRAGGHGPQEARGGRRVGLGGGEGPRTRPAASSIPTRSSRKEQLDLFPRRRTGLPALRGRGRGPDLACSPAPARRPGKGRSRCPSCCAGRASRRSCGIRNTQEGVTARAREFPQVRIALHSLARKKPLAPGQENLCPRCRIPLAEAFYEGVAVRACGRCRGRLVDAGSGRQDRRPARDRFLGAAAREGPAVPRDGPSAIRSSGRRSRTALGAAVPCPACGYRMVAPAVQLPVFRAGRQVPVLLEDLVRLRRAGDPAGPDRGPGVEVAPRRPQSKIFSSS